MKKITIYGLLLFVFGMIVVSCSNLDESISKQYQDNSIYTEPLTTNLGKFIVKSVVGNENWTIDSKGYALMSGYVDANNNADESWLISPEIDLTSVPSAFFTFDHCPRYFANVLTEASVWISEGYKNDSLPKSATWTQLTTYPFSDPGDWTFQTTEQISLKAYSGKRVRIAFKYISTTTKAGTWELKNFLVQKGEAINPTLNSGKETKPYTVFEAVKNLGYLKFVSGYVVGYTWGNKYYFSTDTCTQATNIILADVVSPTDMYYSKCLVVQLPVGVIRDSLNLKNNKLKRFAKKLTIYGTLGTASSGFPQMDGTSYSILPNSTTVGVRPPIFSETFATTLGEFTSQNITGDQFWAFSSTYKCALMTGYIKTTYQNIANEDWLISPEIDLTSIATPKLSFDHVTAYFGAVATEATIWISEDYISGLPSTATWAQLTTPAFVSASSYTFGNSGEISLANYTGKKIKFAFKYVSTATKAGTWEIKNVIVKP
ncbi:MAG: choice-of-anchor J domain-containing protein [Paludibacter sp.]